MAQSQTLAVRLLSHLDLAEHPLPSSVFSLWGFFFILSLAELPTHRSYLSVPAERLPHLALCIHPHIFTRLCLFVFLFFWRSGVEMWWQAWQRELPVPFAPNWISWLSAKRSPRLRNSVCERIFMLNLSHSSCSRWIYSRGEHVPRWLRGAKWSSRGCWTHISRNVPINLRNVNLHTGKKNLYDKIIMLFQTCCYRSLMQKCNGNGMMELFRHDRVHINSSLRTRWQGMEQN